MSVLCGFSAGIFGVLHKIPYLNVFISDVMHKGQYITKNSRQSES